MTLENLAGDEPGHVVSLTYILVTDQIYFPLFLTRIPSFVSRVRMRVLEVLNYAPETDQRRSRQEDGHEPWAVKNLKGNGPGPLEVNGHEMPQVVSRRTYTAETRAHPQVGSRGIYGVQTGIGTGCSPSTSFPPVTIIPNTHLTTTDGTFIQPQTVKLHKELFNPLVPKMCSADPNGSATKRLLGNKPDINIQNLSGDIVLFVDFTNETSNFHLAFKNDCHATPQLL